MRTVFHLAGDDRSGVTRTLLAFATAGVVFQQKFVLWPDIAESPRASDWLRGAGAEVVAPVLGRFTKLRTYRALLRGPGACALAHVDGDVVWLYLARRLGLLPRRVRIVALRHNTGQLLRDRPPGWFGAWARCLVAGYRTADAVVAVGPDVAGDLSALRVRCIEIRNPVDIRALGRLPEPVAVRTFLFMGRLNEPGAGVYKDAATVIRALARAGRDDLRLVVAGDGPMRPRYAELAAALGVAGRVSFLGWVEPEGALASADAVVLSAIGPEGYPLVGAEAAAAGRLLVFSQGSGMSGFEGLGRSFPAGDAAGLAAIMGELAALPQSDVRAASANGRVWAARHHDPEAWARRWSEVVAGA